MKKISLISQDYVLRIEEILDLSWRILKTRFVDGRHQISKEAPFQHYFAHIISVVGEQYCTKRDDIFIVDLETKLVDFKGKNKYIDITCSFLKQNISCAIELKFKTAQQGAQDHGRIDAFVDIESVEIACAKYGYNIGRFYMITNSTAYIKKSRKGVGTIFTTYDGARTGANAQFHCPDSKGREKVIVNLKNPYQFEWENVGKWYFLELRIK